MLLKLTILACKRAVSDTTTFLSSFPFTSTTRTSLPLSSTNYPRMPPRKSSLSLPTWLLCNKIPTPQSLPSSPTTTPSTSPSTPSSRRLAISCSRASRTTTRSSTTTNTTRDRLLVSKPRSQLGNRSAKPRTPQGQHRSNHCFPRTNGRGCSSCRRSLAGWRRCSTRGRWSSMLGKWMASRPASAARCLR